MGLKVGMGWLGSGAQSLRAWATWTKPARSGQGGVAGVVGDGEHLVAQGGDDQEVHGVEEAGHLGGQQATC